MASVDSAHTWKVEIGVPGGTFRSGIMLAPMTFVTQLADSVDATGGDMTDYVLSDLRMVEGDGGLTATLQVSLYNPARDITAWEEVIWTADPGDPAEEIIFGGYVADAHPEPAKVAGKIVWRVKAEGYMARANRTQLLRKTYINSTVGTIIDDMFTTAGLLDFDSTTHVDAGSTLVMFTTNGETLSAAMNRLMIVAAQKAATPWAWRIDPEKNVIAGAASSNAAPFDVSDSTNADYISYYPADKGSVVKKIDASDIRNRITVRGGTQASDTQTETFSGDGATVLFKLAHKPIRDIVSIKIGGVLQTHGTDWLHNPVSYDVLTNYSAGTVKFTAAPAAAANNIEVKYRYDEAVLVTVSDITSYGIYGYYFDFEIEDRSITNEDDATDLANAMLEQYANGVTHGSFTVGRLGLRAGQQLALKFDDLSIDGNYPIRRVTYEMQGASVYVDCTVNWGGRAESFAQAWASGQSSIKSAYSQATSPNIDGEVGTLRVRKDIIVGTSTNIVQLSATDATYRLWAGHTTAASAAFRVTKAGVLTATGAVITGNITATTGTFGGWTGAADNFYSGDMKFDSTNKRIYFDPVVYLEWNTGVLRLNDSFVIIGDLQSYTITATNGTSEFENIDITDDFAINTNKFTVAGASGNTLIAGTLGVTGDVAINTNKFTVAAATGNTVIAGTLDVRGAISNSGGNVAVADTLTITNDLYLNTNKFQVFAASGNVYAAGFVDAAAGFKDNGTAGIDSSWTVAVGDVVTVSGGIITAIA